MSKAITPMECYRALSKNKDLAQGIQKGKTCYAVLMDPYSCFSSWRQVSLLRKMGRNHSLSLRYK